MRCRKGGMKDPVRSLCCLVYIGGLEWDSKLGSTMNEASQPYQLIDLAVHLTHFNLNVLKLSANVSIIVFQLSESVSYVRSGARVSEPDFKRASFIRSEITNVLPAILEH